MLVDAVSLTEIAKNNKLILLTEIAKNNLRVLLQGFKNLKPLRMIPIHIEGASSWLTGSGPFANGSDMLSMSHLRKK